MAARLKTDPSRRKKAYRLIQRRLQHHSVGTSGNFRPTYVYPVELKMLIRKVFPEGVCDYDDPSHDKVVIISMEDLKGLNSSEAANSDKEITYDELKALMGPDSGLILVDVRSKDEWGKGHIPGSINMPLENVETDLSLDAAAFKAKYGVAKPPLDYPTLVFHCQTGRRSGIATEKARNLGFVKARNYTGSYKEWSEKEGK
ncbi:thiosulfate:glutathione sulfurtransferase-like [Chanos chanos]|uniref:Thiosulfate:glutathione sulfurtransferase-like n=1 Tax=Chanos chanos TaxID=29144 RepID=A0A6J2UM73_CHACN|nr:thiosulfate:glutathione sulfurtransferase-like [Chanos chanos]